MASLLVRKIEIDARGAPEREIAGHGAGGDQRAGGGVLEQEGEALGRERRIERHVGAAGLEDGERGHHHRQPARREEADLVAGRDAAPHERVGEATRATIELAVGERLVPEDHGDGVRPPRGFGREERRDAGLARVVGGRLVPGDHDALPLLVAADRERAQRRRGGGDDALEEDAEVLEQALHRGAVEEIGVEDERGGEALRAFGHGQREVELG